MRIAQPCRYCFYSVVQKWVFHPAGATRCPDKRELSAGPLPHAKFHVYRAECGNTAPQIVKILNFGHKFVSQRRLVCSIFLRNSQRLYASLGSFQIFSLVAFGGQTTKL